MEVNKFLEYRYHAENQLSLDEEQNVMDLLSDSIREKLKVQSNMYYIEKFHIFKLFSFKCQEKLAYLMKSECTLNN